MTLRGKLSSETGLSGYFLPKWRLSDPQSGISPMFGLPPDPSPRPQQLPSGSNGRFSHYLRIPRRDPGSCLVAQTGVSATTSDGDHGIRKAGFRLCLAGEELTSLGSGEQRSEVSEMVQLSEGGGGAVRCFRKNDE